MYDMFVKITKLHVAAVVSGNRRNCKMNIKGEKAERGFYNTQRERIKVDLSFTDKSFVRERTQFAWLYLFHFF